MTRGATARVMAVVDATPIWRWLALATGVVLVVGVFWGGTVGRVDESRRAAEVACRAGLVATGGASASAEVVLAWELDESSTPATTPQCSGRDDLLIGAHEALVALVVGVASADGRLLAVIYIAFTAAAVGGIVRRVPGPGWLRGLTGTALVLVVADGSVTSAFTSLDPAPMVVVGVLAVACAALPRASLWGLAGGALLVASSLGAPWRAEIEIGADVVDRYETAAASVVAPRDVGDGVSADAAGRSAGTCRVCVVSNLGDHVRALAPVLVPITWASLARVGLELLRRARRAGDRDAGAVGGLVVASVAAAAALLVISVLDATASVADTEAVTVFTGLAAALAIPTGYHLIVLGRRLDVCPGALRRAAAAVAGWLVVPVPETAPAPVVPAFVPSRPRIVVALPPRPDFAALAGRSPSEAIALRRRHPSPRHRYPVVTGPALARRSGRHGRAPPIGGRDPPLGVPRLSSRAPPWCRYMHRTGRTARAPPAGARRLAVERAPDSVAPLGRSVVGCQPARIGPAESTRNLSRRNRNARLPGSRGVPNPHRDGSRRREPTLMGVQMRWPEPLPGRPLTATVVLGTRPEAIKLAPVIRTLAGDPRFDGRVVHTGQHATLASDILSLFDVDVDVTLDLLRPGQGLVELLGRAIVDVGAELATAPPDVVVVQGDTTTAAGAALAATQLAIPVAHVEAGLRSGDRRAPFPEEDNRRIITSVASIHLAPTAAARDHLAAEGVAAEAITITGNTGIDALDTIVAGGVVDDPIAARVVSHDGPVVLVTTHRRESWGDDMAGIASAVRRLVQTEDRLLAVVPMHPNPTVRDVLAAELGTCARALLCEPLSYAALANVMASSSLVLTDSGGLQEEAPRLGVPVLVLRRTTERPEGVAAGAAKLVGTDPDMIVRTARAVLHDDALRRSMGRSRDLYGDGRAADRVVHAIAHRFGLGDRPMDFAASGRTEPRHH